MVSRTRTLIEQMLSAAEASVTEGERRLEAQRERVAGLEKAGRAAEQSRRLLKIMEQTQVLQLGHIAMLRRDLNQPDYAVPLPYRPPPPPPGEWRDEPPASPSDLATAEAARASGT